MQYWSAVVYNAEVAVKFSELPSIQNYPDLPYSRGWTDGGNLAERVDECPLNRVIKHTIRTTRAVRYTE